MDYLRALIFLGIVQLFMIGCAEKPNHQAVLMKIFLQEKEIHCELASLKDSITHEWDEMNALLEKNLSSNMPAEEKNNMLKVRNAGLIRMFESFDEVDEAVKRALSEVEQKDREITARIVDLKKKSQKIESQKMALFEIMSQLEGEEAVRNYKEMYGRSLKEDCE